MSNLHQTVKNFNNNLHISSNGGDISTDAGLSLVSQFVQRIQLPQLFQEKLSTNDTRLFSIHKDSNLLLQMVLMTIGQYHQDWHAKPLQKDPIFTQFVGVEKLASQSTLSRFIDRMDDDAIQSLHHINQAIIDRGRLYTNQQQVIFDLDSTHFTTYGKQESTNKNAHYNFRHGYHPLVLFDGVTGALIKSELRPGNVYTSTGVVDFIREPLEHYLNSLPTSDILVRGDSGFAVPDLYDLCEDKHVCYVIRLKNNTILSKSAQDKLMSIKLDAEEKGVQPPKVVYLSFDYQAKSWRQKRRVCVKATLSDKGQQELFYSTTAIVTNLSDAIDPKTVFKTYHQRGAMENMIKEAKNGFNIGKTDYHYFKENYARMLINAIAYNVIQVMKQMVMPKDRQSNSISKLRIELFKIAGKLTYHARRIHLKLSSYHVWKNDYFDILDRISRLQFA